MKTNHGIIILFLIFFTSFCYGQTKNQKVKNYKQRDIDSYKIENGIYNFWWSKRHEYKWFPKGDTLPYFVDDRKYQGLLNYGIRFIPKKRGNGTYTEDQDMFFLDVFFNKCEYNAKDSIIIIEGTIKGSEYRKYDRNYAKKNNNIDVFIGHRKDTTNYLYFEKRDSEIFNINYKGKKIKSNIILDTFPSFFMEKYINYRTNAGNERKFRIESKIDEKSVLIIGAGFCYAEIFEIGKMVFLNEKKNKNSTLGIRPPLKSIIRNNELVSVKEKKIIPKYYKNTEQAEKYILKKQYGKAKLIYEKLLEDNQYVFARDMHNAVRCAIIARDYTSAIYWSEKLVLKGVPKTYFKSKIFNRINKQKSWKEFLKRFDSLNKEHQKGLNNNLISRLNELINIDQTDYVKNSKGGIEKSKLIETTKLVDKEFIKLVIKEGFPTEEKIGATMSKDSMSIAINPKFFVLIIHSYQKKHETSKEIKDIRKNAADKFEYDAQRDNMDVFKSVGNTCLKIYKGNLYNGKSCYPKNDIQIKKVAYTFNNEHGFIVDTGSYTIIPVENEKEDDKFVFDNNDFIMKLTDDWFYYEN